VVEHSIAEAEDSFATLWRELDATRERQRLAREALAARINKRFGPGSLSVKTLHDRMAKGRRVSWHEMRRVVLALDLDERRWKRRWEHAEDLRRGGAIARPHPPAIPRELPRPSAHFTGRQSELSKLRALLGGGAGAVVISAIDGMGGVGKSALAIEVANQLAATFPDGQLYLDLHGATPGLEPMEPLKALGRLLRALGENPARIPAELDEAAARFRSMAAERRLLLLLDNAHSVEQVRPLLPSSPACAVLITSRRVLSTLEVADSLHLGVLEPEQALELLGRIAGAERVTAEPEAAAEIVNGCGHLPLAIRIAGARLTARPVWPLRELADRLRDAARRLDELAAGDLAVRASFDVSLRALEQSADPADRAAAAAFGLLSLPGGPDLSVAAAASLLDQPEPAARALLERLVDAQLLQTLHPGRYRFHDLVRLYARQSPTPRHPEPTRRAALTRLFAFYAATAWRTLALLRPHDHRLVSADPRWGDGGLELGDVPAALAWLEAERANLLSAVAEIARTAPASPAALAGQLARALFGFFEGRGYWSDCVQVNQTVVELAGRVGDRAALAHAKNDLAGAYGRFGRYPETLECLGESLALFRELDDRQGQAASLTNFGIMYGLLGRTDEAIACLRESLSIRRALGDRYRQASPLANLGTVYQRVGRYEEAIGCLRESLAVFRELGDRQRQCAALTNLGIVYQRLGRYQEAIGYHQESLGIERAIGDRLGQATSLTDLGIVYQRQGRHRQAIESHRRSLTILRELGDRRGQALALRDLGDALQAVGRPAEAGTAWREALSICAALRIPEADEVRTRLESPHIPGVSN
jgi:tetratricopeptide (TPR) repeat protein